MRAEFASLVHQHMKHNKRIWVLTNDLGYKMWDSVRKDYPKRFINVGAAEQTMLSMGVGLALEGQIPLCYSITTFLLYRSFEVIRNYINYESIPVKLIGSGREKDYIHDGISHWPLEEKQIMKIYKNIHSVWPKSSLELPDLVDEMLKSDKPWYINLRR